MEAIRNLLSISDVHVVRKTEGSVRLTLRLPRSAAKQLGALVREGRLAQYGVASVCNIIGDIKPGKTILVVDHQPIFRLGVSRVLQLNSAFDVIEADSMSAANLLLSSHSIDLVIVDISLPDAGGGLELIRQQRAMHRHTRWLVMSAFRDTSYQERAKQVGAHVFVSKRVIPQDLLNAVEALLDGRELPSDLSENSDDSDIIDLAQLSKREQAIFRLIAEGNSEEQIANSLSRSPKTIAAFRDRIQKKLNLNSSAALIRLASHWNISQKGS